MKINSTAGNAQQIRTFLLHSFLAYTALYGIVVALWRRDWRVVPLVAWFLVSAYLLWRQAPLFAHHLVILIPPLVGLASMGIGPLKNDQLDSTLIWRITNYSVSVVCLLLVLFTVFTDIQGDRAHYLGMRIQANADDTRTSLKAAQDLQQAVQPGQFVITDAQFVAALAGRSTPPALVDTSNVRISTGFVTTQQVIQEAEQPRVQAILFYTGRLQNLSGFHNWVSQHFHYKQSYGNGKELWVKI